MTWQAWPNDMLSLTLVALGLIAFFMFITHKRKTPPDNDHVLRRSIQRLFALSVKQDFEAAASFLATSDNEILLFSKEPERVKARCRELQELAAKGGVSIERLSPQSEQEHPDYLCEVAVMGAQRIVTRQLWRWVRGRYALLGDV